MTTREHEAPSEMAAIVTDLSLLVLPEDQAHALRSVESAARSRRITLDEKTALVWLIGKMGGARGE